MQKGSISISELKSSIEYKAYAYGVSSVIATLLGEYVVHLLKDVAVLKKGPEKPPAPLKQFIPSHLTS